MFVRTYYSASSRITIALYATEMTDPDLFQDISVHNISTSFRLFERVCIHETESISSSQSTE